MACNLLSIGRLNYTCMRLHALLCLRHSLRVFAQFALRIGSEPKRRKSDWFSARLCFSIPMRTGVIVAGRMGSTNHSGARALRRIDDHRSGDVRYCRGSSLPGSDGRLIPNRFYSGSHGLHSLHVSITWLTSALLRNGWIGRETSVAVIRSAFGTTAGVVALNDRSSASCIGITRG